MNREPCRLTLTELSAGIAQGAISIQDATASSLDAIARLDGRIEAFALVDPEAARAQAAALEGERRAGRLRGPLHGIPFAIKDIFYTAGLKTSAGSRALADFIPAYDATTVSRLRQAGAVIIGKSTTTEFAYFEPAATRNPWNPAYTPGGSSSGSAAAVAARMVAGALGSQTVGSTIRPAAYCGVVGLKPSHGRISTYGVIPLAPSLDHVGLFGRCVSDCALVLEVLAGFDPRDRRSCAAPAQAYSAAVKESLVAPRIGLPRTFFMERGSEEVHSHTRAIAELLIRGGASVVELELPEIFSVAPAAINLIAQAEAAACHREMLAKRPEQLGEKFRALLEKGLKLSAADYIDARERQAEFRASLAQTLATVDAIMTPATPAPAPQGLSATGDPSFNASWTLGGFPAIALPSGISREGLPLAIQLVAGPMQDYQLLQVARWCEVHIGFQGMPALMA